LDTPYEEVMTEGTSVTDAIGPRRKGTTKEHLDKRSGEGDVDSRIQVYSW